MQSASAGSSFEGKKQFIFFSKQGLGSEIFTNTGSFCWLLRAWVYKLGLVTWIKDGRIRLSTSSSLAAENPHSTTWVSCFLTDLTASMAFLTPSWFPCSIFNNFKASKVQKISSCGAKTRVVVKITGWQTTGSPNRVALFREGKQMAKSIGNGRGKGKIKAEMM